MPPSTTTTTNNTSTNSATPTVPDLQPETVGPIGQFLRSLGIPYAEIVGAIITFALTLLVLYVMARVVLVPLANRMLDARGVNRDARQPLLRLLRIIIGFTAIAVAFGLAGYGNFLASFATIGAAATLAIGFALKDLIANFVAGVFIYIDRPFQIGDWIEWPSSGDIPNAGIVKDISLRVTRIQTFDNELLTVPNSLLTQDVINNPVAEDELRLKCTFGIGYGDDVEKATQILYEEAERHPDILSDPAPTIRMGDEALADSSVGLVARFWIANPSRAKFLQVRSEYIKNVKQRFDDAGIEIPYPQRGLTGTIELRNQSDLEEPRP